MALGTVCPSANPPSRPGTAGFLVRAQRLQPQPEAADHSLRFWLVLFQVELEKSLQGRTLKSQTRGRD